ncbi:MAG: glutathione S-transferase N-terminal domain-containing protein, partial [SAR324 cluster bacterium]
MLKIYGFYRSSAAYRVRIALELKALDWESIPVNLRLDEQKQDSFLQNNPQGLVPVLESDGKYFAQSLAIIEYLDELH